MTKILIEWTLEQKKAIPLYNIIMSILPNVLEDPDRFDVYGYFFTDFPDEKHREFE